MMIPCPGKMYTLSYMFRNYFQIFWNRGLLASACRWRTQKVDMMCNARLFTRVAKPDFTEHRRDAVGA